MQTYHKITIKLDSIPWVVEWWTEHNHTQAYSGGALLFDGDKCKAHIMIENEVERLQSQASEFGMSCEVIR